jgi:HSP20 family protein
MHYNNKKTSPVELHKFIGEQMVKTDKEFKVKVATTSMLFNDDAENQILSPLSCLREYGTYLLLEFDLPLVDKQNIQITFNENSISIVAKLREEYLEEKLGKIIKFRYFKKTITLPNKINNKTYAQFKNGRLKITIPKIISGNEIKIE